MKSPTSCQSSLDVAEPLVATATEADVWICLEYRRPWGAKAFGASELPPQVKEPLGEALESVPTSRLQFIRRPGRTRGPYLMYIARPNRREPDAFVLEFGDHADLARLDFKAMAAGDPPRSAAPATTPWVLVCGNGRRDMCCAKHGTAVYRALAGRRDAEVWLSNHQGGHRFAANTVVLPIGIQFGRLRPGLAPKVVKACLDGLWDLEHTRGRVVYPRPAQAAEHFLRQQIGERRVNGLRLVSAEALSPDIWRVRFEETATGVVHTLDVSVGMSDFEVIKTTGDSSPAKVPRYTLA